VIPAGPSTSTTAPQPDLAVAVARRSASSSARRSSSAATVGVIPSNMRDAPRRHAPATVVRWVREGTSMTCIRKFDELGAAGGLAPTGDAPAQAADRRAAVRTLPGPMGAGPPGGRARRRPVGDLVTVIGGGCCGPPAVGVLVTTTGRSRRAAGRASAGDVAVTGARRRWRVPGGRAPRRPPQVAGGERP
jgi:hypothetical protein